MARHLLNTDLGVISRMSLSAFPSYVYGFIRVFIHSFINSLINSFIYSIFISFSAFIIANAQVIRHPF